MFEFDGILLKPSLLQPGFHVAGNAYCLALFVYLYIIPDPGALNSCMHTCPNKHIGFIRV